MINADDVRQFRHGPAMDYFSCADGGLGGALLFWAAAALPRMNWLMPTFTGQPRSAACLLMLAIWTHDRVNTYQHGQAEKRGRHCPSSNPWSAIRRLREVGPMSLPLNAEPKARRSTSRLAPRFDFAQARRCCQDVGLSYATLKTGSRHHSSSIPTQASNRSRSTRGSSDAGKSGPSSNAVPQTKRQWDDNAIAGTTLPFFGLSSLSTS
jgi:hypothetical protein